MKSLKRLFTLRKLVIAYLILVLGTQVATSLFNNYYQARDIERTRQQESLFKLHSTIRKYETQLEQKKSLEAEIDKLNEEIQELKLSKVKKPSIAPPVYAEPTGTCVDWIRQAGVTSTDQSAAYNLIMKESGCRTSAVNPSSGACGLMQALPCSKMSTHGADYRTNPITQIRWGADYVKARYGGWAQANAFQQANGWY